MVVVMGDRFATYCLLVNCKSSTVKSLDEKYAVGFQEIHETQLLIWPDIRALLRNIFLGFS